MAKVNTIQLPGSGRAAAPTGVLGTARLRIIALTGVLVVVPALLNAGYDVYATVAQLPRSANERDNLDLFRKYFGKAPLVVNALPIRSTLGVKDVRFSVYEEGDVHVEFGDGSQWFKFAKVPPKASGLLSLFPSANAQTVPPATAAAQSARRQIEHIEGGRLIRVRELPTGRAEEIHYDLRTGQIVKRQNVDAQTVFKSGAAQKLPETTRVRELSVLSQRP